MIVENLIDAIFKPFSLFIRICYPYILIVEVVYQTFGIEENFTFESFSFQMEKFRPNFKILELFL